MARPDPAAWLAARIDDRFVLETVNADASFRRYFRARSARGTFILMDAPPEHEDCRPFVHTAALLRDAGVHSPEVLDADLEAGFLMLEDFGDETYLDAIAESSRIGLLYTDALSALVRMQSIAAQVPAYDERLLRFELSLFGDWYLIRHLGVEPPEWLHDVNDRLVEAALAQPQVFVHRDYHARNLMVVAGDNPGVLDFQDAVRGPVSYDLVSLLRDAYVEWPDAQVDAWIAEYRSLAARAGIECGPDATTFRRWFDLMGLQRQLKVAGIFARLNHRDGKARYLADIPRTLGYARRAAAHYPEFAPLARWLEAAC
ncbi:MAG: phosphotransferase [Gammaproteobacteria bacterium]